MRLFDLFGKNRIEPTWQYRAKSWLWHLRPTDAGAIVGEERDPVRKVVTFFSVNRDTGAVFWRDASFVDQWWTGIEAVHRDMLFLHGFVTPELPQHRGITAVDLVTGRKLWERPELRFAGARDDRLLAAEGNPASERLCSISRATGQTEAWVGTEDALKFADQSAELNEPMHFPVPVEAVAAIDPSIEACVRTRLAGVQVAGPISVLVHGARCVISFHEHVNFPDVRKPHYNNILMVVDRKAEKVVFSMILDAGIGSLVPEPFFVQRNTLFCIRERRTLLALPLGGHHNPSAI